MATYNTVDEIKNRIVAARKNIPLTRIATGSGVTYKTVHDIVSGKSKRVSTKVEQRFNKYFSKLNMKPATTTPTTPTVTVVNKSTQPPKQVQNTATFQVGNNLESEINATRARLNYLLTVKSAEEVYLKAINKK